MLTTTLGWLIAGLCFEALVGLWFYVSYRALIQKRQSMEAIGRQLAMHRRLYMQERGGSNDSSAQNVLLGKQLAYNKAEKEYNDLLKNPLYLIAGFCLGFRPTKKG